MAVISVLLSVSRTFKSANPLKLAQRNPFLKKRNRTYFLEMVHHVVVFKYYVGIIDKIVLGTCRLKGADVENNFWPLQLLLLHQIIWCSFMILGLTHQLPFKFTGHKIIDRRSIAPRVVTAPNQALFSCPEVVHVGFRWIDCYVAVLLVWRLAPFWRQSLRFHSRGLRRSGFGCRCHCVVCKLNCFLVAFSVLVQSSHEDCWTEFLLLFGFGFTVLIFNVCGRRGMLADLSKLYDAPWVEILWQTLSKSFYTVNRKDSLW